jgi:hypothetical protein
MQNRETRFCKLRIEITGISSFVNCNTWSPKDLSSEKSWYALVTWASALVIILVKTLNVFSGAKGRKFVFSLMQCFKEQSLTHEI